MKEIIFGIIEWWCCDNIEKKAGEDTLLKELKYNMYIFGRNAENKSIACKIENFNPYYYIKIPDNVKLNTETDRRRVKQKILNYIKDNFWMCNYKCKNCENEKQICECKNKKGDSQFNGNYFAKEYENSLIENECEFVKKKDIYLFNNEKEYNYIKIVFKNQTCFKKSKNIFKLPITIKDGNGPLFNNEKVKLYESNFEPFMRFAHIQDIKMAGWVKINKYKKAPNITRMDEYYVVDYKDIIGITKNEIPHFTQMSWDIEVYSKDNSFPSPKDPENEIFNIGVIFKNYKEKIIEKYLITNKKCNEIENVNIIKTETETELISKFIKLIKDKNPDILYGYNTDSFDFEYLIERCKVIEKDGGPKLLNHLLLNVSRFNEKATNYFKENSFICKLKKETFSSSAYSDSDFNRLYIPGRLNYDLLIHYKRGLKKYESYKLDYIAEKILGENKHEMSMKDMFKAVRNNEINYLTKTAKYCMQDTLLLQRLVDYQKILVGVIQLANITCVPVSYLLTKGQTIKVMSQIMKKAREMNYLVPHTNFNSNNYNIILKTRENIDYSLWEKYINCQIIIDCGKKEIEFEGKKFVVDNIISGKIISIKSNKEIDIISDTQLDENHIIYKFKEIKIKTEKSEIKIAPSNFHSIYIGDSEDSFTGACVLEPIPGIHLENIVVLDFASLYPTIMISRNLCFSSIIDGKEWTEEKLIENNIKYEKIEWEDNVEFSLHKKCQKWVSTLTKNDYCGKNGVFEEEYIIPLCKKMECKYKLDLAVQNLTYNESEIENEKLKCDFCKNKAYTKYKLKSTENETDKFYFCLTHDPLKKDRNAQDKLLTKKIKYSYIIVQPFYDNDGKLRCKGVVPSLLEDLYAERKNVKKQMKTADSHLKDILDSQQLSIKISLNSVYGFVSRNKGDLVKGELGKLTTSIGRNLINISKDYAENEFENFINNNHETINLNETIKLNETSNLTNTEIEMLKTKYNIQI